MLVRPIEPHDVEAVVKLSETFYDEMKFDDYGYRLDLHHVTTGFHRAANKDGALCLVCYEVDNLVGVIFFALTNQTWYFRDRVMATEIVWHADPKLAPIKRIKVMKELLKSALVTLKEIGCKLVASSVPEGLASPRKLLEMEGFSTPQTYFMKEL